MTCLKNHLLQPMILNGYPSRNVRGETILYCECGVYDPEKKVEVVAPKVKKTRAKKK